MVSLQLLYFLSLFSIGFRVIKFGINQLAFSLYPKLIPGFLCVPANTPRYLMLAEPS